MKKINAIIKGITDASTSERKANRIMRQIDQAIDMAKDSAQDCRDKAEDLLNDLGKVSGANQTESLGCLLNNYKDKVLEGKEWESVAEVFEDLKKNLNEDVKAPNEVEGF